MLKPSELKKMNAGKEIQVKTDNIATLAGNIKDIHTPLGEVVVNGVEQSKGMKDRKVEVKLFKEDDGLHFLVLNTGRPVEDWGKTFQNGNDHQLSANELLNKDNHLRRSGLKLAISIICPYRQKYQMGTLYVDRFEVVTGPYQPIIIPYIESEIEKWPYPGYVTFFEAVFENPNIEIDITKFKKFLTKKFNFELIKDPNLEIYLNEEKIVPKLHAKAKTEQQLKKCLFEKTPNGVVLLNENNYSIKKMDDGTAYAIIPCPLINGVVQVIICEANKGCGASDTKGVIVSNLGISVDFKSGTEAVIARTSVYNSPKKVKFKGIPNDRKETNPWAVYIDLIPGPGVSLPFNSDKSGIDWVDALPTTIDNMGSKLREFIDNLVGENFREADRQGQENISRKEEDKILEAVFGPSMSNYIYLKEATFTFCGKTFRLDGLALRITIHNQDKIFDFINKKSKGSLKRYCLDKNDFLGAMPENADKLKLGWKYDFSIIEYKTTKKKNLEASDIDQLIRYAEDLSDVFGLDKKRIPLHLVGPKLDEYTAYHLEKKKKSGFCLSWREMKPVD